MRVTPYPGEMNVVNSTQIRCFLTTAQLQSFSRAAEALYLTQPSVSRYIGQLEQEWGVTLFQRSGRSVVLTAQGEEYYRLCLRCQAEFEALRRKHQAASDQAALSIQYSIFPAWNISKLLYENTEYVMKRHPNWDISLKICPAGALVEELLQGNVGAAFRQNPYMFVLLPLAGAYLAGEAACYLRQRPPLWKRKGMQALLAVAVGAGIVFTVLRNLPGFEALRPQ